MEEILKEEEGESEDEEDGKNEKLEEFHLQAFPCSAYFYFFRPQNERKTPFKRIPSFFGHRKCACQKAILFGKITLGKSHCCHIVAFC